MAKLTSIQRFQENLQNLSFRFHIIISICIRLCLICYSQVHDLHSEVPYTDVDYKVVTDGARQILKGNTPFNRHTYRYSPLLAYMQIPNVVLHPSIGKIIYACFDLLVAILIYAIVRSELQSQCNKAVQYLLIKYGKSSRANANVNYGDTDERNRPAMIAKLSACFWLYNPLTAVISTRGNGDSFSSFFVILTIYLLSKSEDCNKKNKRNWFILLAGLAHGFAIHLRLYPLLFSLAYYLCLSERLVRSLKGFLRIVLFPSSKQLLLVFGTFLSLILITGFFYCFYGWQYIYEAYLYHFVRKDARHNFSLYFLMQYLSGGAIETSLLEKCLIMLPQFLLILYLSFAFGQFRQTLPFCIFAVAFVMVTFNSVVTSQYFVWYLALLPLCLNNLHSITWLQGIAYFILWLVAQGLWLLPAYLLEFKTWNTFYWIGAQGAFFFMINNLLLARLIEHYSFTSFKVNFKKLL